jgi:hypothetical protein
LKMGRREPMKHILDRFGGVVIEHAKKRQGNANANR